MTSMTSYGTLAGVNNSTHLTVSSGSESEDVESSGQATLGKTKKTICQRILALAKRNLLVIFLILSMVIGIGLGAGLREVDLDEREQMYLRFPGEILMNMLQLLILPLIVSSLISGLTSLDTRSSGKLGARAILYYLTTTLLAVILGIILVLSIRPGERGDAPDAGGTEFRKVEAADTFLDLIRQMFPDNIVEATFRKKLTVLEEKEPTEEQKNLSILTNTTIEPEYKATLERSFGINMLGLVVFSVAMGIAINRIGDKGKPLKDFIDSLCEATLQLVSAVIWYSPLGVLFLVAAQVVSMDDPAKTFEQLSFYFLTVIAGLFVHGFIALPLLYFIFVRKNPYKYIMGVLQAMLTALGTASSSATLPITMKNLEENNGIDPRVTSFVAPVGATINMDGTALYEAVAVIFIGQIRGFDMGIGNVITICLTSTAAAIGAAGVPQAGLVTMVIVLTSVGFPTEDVGMILAVDWLLDRFRTMINVLGDAFGAGIVYHYSKADLLKMDMEDQSAVVKKDGITQPNGDVNGDLKEVFHVDAKWTPPENVHGGVNNPGFDSSKL